METANHQFSSSELKGLDQADDLKSRLFVRTSYIYNASKP
jgi:hypothetical protein